MAFLTRTLAAPATLCLLFSLPTQANNHLSVNASARAGLEQQSNVNISELAQASGRADVATLLEADVSAQWQATPALRLESGYSVQDKNYHQTADFDTRLHLAYVDASYQLGSATVGANVYYARAELDQTHFLTLPQASLYSMHALSDSIFLRPALTLGEKTFARFSERDAINANASVDAFWFFAGGKRFVALGLVYEEEDSRDNAFSYQAPGVRLKLSGNYRFWRHDHQLQLGAKWTQRSYQAPLSGNAADSPRQDKHSQFDVNWQVELTAHLAALAKLEHGDFASTLDSADYRETRSSLALQLRF